MLHQDITILTTDVREIQENGKRIVRFRLQAPGLYSQGQESEIDCGAVLRLVANWEVAPPSLTKVIELGEMLGNALFPLGYIRDAVLASLSVHKNRHNSRLRLILNLAGPLHSIPWEFALLHSEQGEATQNEMLGLMTQVSIVRQLDKTTPQLGGTKATQLPAHVVVALADPTYRLNLADERRILQESIAPMERVEVTYVEPATARNLLGDRERVDVFHFAGHGDFVERPTPGTVVGRGALVLDDGEGNAEVLDAGVLANRLINAGVRVAVLGACLTARRDDVNLWSSTAANLLNGGLGAVVAMQFTILDSSAVAFAEAFYTALTRGVPIDQAVTIGRLAIFERSDFRGFGTPVLYMSESDGVVFPELTNDPVLRTEREQSRVIVNIAVEVVAGKVVGIEVEKMSGGEAKATVTAATVEAGATVIGFKAGSLTSGDVDVDMDIESVAAGASVYGAKLKSIG